MGCSYESKLVAAFQSHALLTYLCTETWLGRIGYVLLDPHTILVKYNFILSG